jgi:hypothetical protein
MAGNITADVEFFKITGEPSWIRRIFFDFLPFWQGSTPQFRLIIEATTEVEHESKFLYHIEYTNGEASPKKQLTISPIKARAKRVIQLEPIPVISTGDAILEITEVLETRMSGYKPVYSFHITSRSWLWLTLIAGLLAGIFSAIVNYLLGRIG